MNFDDTQELREWRLQVRDFLNTERPEAYDPGAMGGTDIREQGWWDEWRAEQTEGEPIYIVLD